MESKKILVEKKIIVERWTCLDQSHNHTTREIAEKCIAAAKNKTGRKIKKWSTVESRELFIAFLDGASISEAAKMCNCSKEVARYHVDIMRRKMMAPCSTLAGMRGQRDYWLAMLDKVYPAGKP